MYIKNNFINFFKVIEKYAFSTWREYFICKMKLKK